jgi:hypothetical protein
MVTELRNDLMVNCVYERECSPVDATNIYCRRRFTG